MSDPTILTKDDEIRILRSQLTAVTERAEDAEDWVNKLSAQLTAVEAEWNEALEDRQMVSEETRRFRYACRIMIVFGGICLTGALIPGFGIIGALGGFVMGWFGCAHAHARGWFDPSPAIDQEGEG